MNSKGLVGAIVGGAILFVWQFLSWGVINIHSVNQKYTPKQDSILQFLSQNLEGDGAYFLPGLPADASNEDHQKLRESSNGKPWATIAYHKSMDIGMGMNMARSFIINVLLLAIIIWILLKEKDASFMSILTTCLGVGLISYFSTHYAESIWFKTNTIPNLIDAIVSWTLLGSWLGFWLRRS